MLQAGVLAAWAGMSPAVRVSAAAAAGSAARQVNQRDAVVSEQARWSPVPAPWVLSVKKADW